MALQKIFDDEDLDDEVEELIQRIASGQGFDAIMNVIDSLISTIEYQEVIIYIMTS